MWYEWVGNVLLATRQRQREEATLWISKLSNLQNGEMEIWRNEDLL
jgi:hypothetical protein